MSKPNIAPPFSRPAPVNMADITPPFHVPESKESVAPPFSRPAPVNMADITPPFIVQESQKSAAPPFARVEEMERADITRMKQLVARARSYAVGTKNRKLQTILDELMVETEKLKKGTR